MSEDARLLLIQGVNPMDERRRRKKASNPEDRAFKVIALRWWEQQQDSWSSDHAARVRHWIQNDAQAISELAIEEIDTGHITELMLSIEASGSPKKAPVILSVINRIFGYALAHRLTRTNPAQGLPLRDIIKPLPKVRHRAAIVNPTELTELIADIDGNTSGSLCTSEALKLIPRVFLRPITNHLKPQGKKPPCSDAAKGAAPFNSNVECPFFTQILIFICLLQGVFGY